MVAQPARAGLIQGCLSVLARLLSDPEAPYRTDPSLTLDMRERMWIGEPGLQNRLVRARDRVLEASRSGMPQTQREVTINGTTYRVLQTLGRGSDGTTYLVQTPQGLRVAKRFHRSLEVMRENLATLNRLRTAGMDVVRIHEVDEANSTVLLDYVPGLSVTDATVSGLDHGLSLDDMNLIGRRFNDYRARFRDARGIEPFNFFLDPATGRFVLIDPW